MKDKILLIAICTSIAVTISCNDHSVKNNIAATAATDTIPAPSKYSVSMVDNKRDPSCGMPVSAEIGDTAHYKNKVIGFCSKECKDEFLKNPDKNIAAADLKK